MEDCGAQIKAPDAMVTTNTEKKDHIPVTSITPQDNIEDKDKVCQKDTQKVLEMQQSVVTTLVAIVMNTNCGCYDNAV